MHAFDHLVNLALSSILIVGGYQFYFLCQRKGRRIPFEFVSAIDERIPFRPEWVWVYSGLYYPTILLLVFLIGSFQEFNYTAFSFIFLLFIQLIVFYAFPVQTPAKWRDYDIQESLSSRFLALVHDFDARSNCFPSMHVSVATLTAFHIDHNLNPIVGHYSEFSFAFPILIGISALLTKQHYFFDIPPGVLFGYVAYQVFCIIAS